MKQFFWKLVICILPVALASWVIALAAFADLKQSKGFQFKVGADLAGGTILVYEVDFRKLQESAKEGKQQEKFDINILATTLKKRIDPNDLYNIVIRPAGGEGRVEIILPTGGTTRTKEAEKAWNTLLVKMKDEFGLPQTIEVPRGKILALADKIQVEKSKDIWAKKLFVDKDAWARLKQAAYDRWAELTPDLTKKPLVNPKIEALDNFKGDRLAEFHDVVREELKGTEAEQSDAGIDAFIKQRAWEEMLEQARQKWPDLKEFKTDMDRIPPDSNEQLVSFIQAKGALVGQAALAILEPLMGKDSFKVELKNAKGEMTPVSAKELADFVKDHYGDSVYAISDVISRTALEIRHERKLTEEEIQKYKDEGDERDITVEEVQRIKDLVTKLGSLEFRILANYDDDKEAIDEAIKMYAGTDQLERLEKLAKQGLAPPPPSSKSHYVVNLARGSGKFNYTWFELGPQERKALNLDNAAKNDASRNRAWLHAQLNKNKATKLPIGGDKFMLQGSVFFTRECKDQNLPEEERRTKQFEYFILTRDPEIEPDDPKETKTKERITGKYLVAAAPDRTAVQPAVHFQFNTDGGNLFADITRKNVPSGTGNEANQVRRHLAIILDGFIMSAPTINSEIRTHGQISGNFSNKDVNNLVSTLRSGQLPATLKQQPVSESTMGPTLGEDTIRAGVSAVVYAFIFVLLFMVVYYRFAGFVASVAVLANLILTVGFMIAVQATFTLPGLAGLVLMLGMAVDANVLIYERLREERERGCSLAQAIRNGYDRALPTILDTHFTSIATGIILYVVGNDQLKGFAISLIVGLIISLFTSLYMTRVMFDIWNYKGWLTKLSMMKLFSKPDFDFMAVRKVMFITTIILSVVGFVLFVGRLPNDLNIDFRGGTSYGGELTESKSIEQLRKLTDEDRQKMELGGNGNRDKVKASSGKDRVPPNVEPADTEGFRFTLTYEGDEPRTIALSNKPQGETSADQVKDIIKRVSELPDVSVELYYPSAAEGAVPKTYFNIRTSEREPELVQAMLDRLLRDGDKALMKKVFMKHETPPTAKSFRLRFQGKDQAYAAASLGEVRAAVEGELLRAFGAKTAKDLPIQFELAGEDKAGADGKYQSMLFKITQSPKQDDVVKAGAALEAAESKLGSLTMIATPVSGRAIKLVFFSESGDPSAGSLSFVKSLFQRELTRAFNVKDKKELPFQYDVVGEGRTTEDGKNQYMMVRFEDELKPADFAKFWSVLRTTEREFSVRPQPDRLENFDSQLATETRLRAMWAILFSWAAILGYLWLRFGNWTFGLAAVICLVHDLFFTLGAIAACHYLHGTWLGNLLMISDFKLDLNAVAALLTLVGYSVSDTIVVFDRIREVRGKNPHLTPQMINDSVNQTLGRTILTAFSVFLVAMVLYIGGGEGLHLFAFVMIMGVLVGTYSSIYIASPLLLITGEGVHEAPTSQPQTEPEEMPA